MRPTLVGHLAPEGVSGVAIAREECLIWQLMHNWQSNPPLGCFRRRKKVSNYHVHQKSCTVGTRCLEDRPTPNSMNSCPANYGKVLTLCSSTPSSPKKARSSSEPYTQTSFCSHYHVFPACPWGKSSKNRSRPVSTNPSPHTSPDDEEAESTMPKERRRADSDGACVTLQQRQHRQSRCQIEQVVQLQSCFLTLRRLWEPLPQVCCRTCGKRRQVCLWCKNFNCAVSGCVDVRLSVRSHLHMLLRVTWGYLPAIHDHNPTKVMLVTSSCVRHLGSLADSGWCVRLEHKNKLFGLTMVSLANVAEDEGNKRSGFSETIFTMYFVLCSPLLRGLVKKIID